MFLFFVFGVFTSTFLFAKNLRGNSEEYQNSLKTARRIIVDGLPEDQAEAEKALLNAIRLKPNSTEATIEYAEFLVLQTKLGAKSFTTVEKAIELVLHTQELDPSSPIPTYAMGEILLMLGKTQEAFQIFSDTRQRYPNDPATIFYNARFLFEVEPKEALKQAEKALLNGASLDRLSSHMISAMKKQAEETKVKESSVIEPYAIKYQNRWFWHYVGLAKAAEGDNQGAEEALRKAIKLGNTVESTLQLGVLEYRKLSPTEGIKLLTQLLNNIQSRPNARKASCALIQAHISLANLKINNNKEATNFASLAINNASKNPELLKYIFEEFLQIKSISLLLKPLEDLVKKTPNEVMPYILLSEAFNYESENNPKLAAQNLEQSKSYLKKALVIAPQDDALYVRLALIQLKQEKMDDALSSMNKAIVINPTSPLHYYNRACILAKSGKLKDSLIDLKRAIEISPEIIELARTDKDFDPIRSDAKTSRDLEMLLMPGFGESSPAI